MAHEGHEDKGAAGQPTSRLQAAHLVPQEQPRDAESEPVQQQATPNAPNLTVAQSLASNAYSMQVKDGGNGVYYHSVSALGLGAIAMKSTGPSTRDGELKSVKYWGAVIADADGPYVFGWATSSEHANQLIENAKKSNIRVLAVVQDLGGSGAQL